jgi:hypothetical protein
MGIISWVFCEGSKSYKKVVRLSSSRKVLRWVYVYLLSFNSMKKLDSVVVSSSMVEIMYRVQLESPSKHIMKCRFSK